MPLFSGCKGPEIVRGLKEIEHSFEKHIYSLAAVKRSALDVKATVWHDEFNLFRTGLKELEVMLQNIINSGFESITTVEEEVELLEVFIQFASREVCTGRGSRTSLWGRGIGRNLTSCVACQVQATWVLLGVMVWMLCKS